MDKKVCHTGMMYLCIWFWVWSRWHVLHTPHKSLNIFRESLSSVFQETTRCAAFPTSPCSWFLRRLAAKVINMSTFLFKRELTVFQTGYQWAYGSLWCIQYLCSASSWRQIPSRHWGLYECDTLEVTIRSVSLWNVLSMLVRLQNQRCTPSES